VTGGQAGEGVAVFMAHSQFIWRDNAIRAIKTFYVAQ
jgi:hypothetical protein